jgi:hypothetical protein
MMKLSAVSFQLSARRLADYIYVDIDARSVTSP